MPSSETDFVGSFAHSCVHCQDLVLDQRLDPLESPKPVSPAHSWSSASLGSDKTVQASLLTKHISLKAAYEAGSDGCKFMQYITPTRALARSQPPNYIEPEDDWYLEMCLSIGEYNGDYYSSILSTFVAPRELRGLDRIKYSSAALSLSVYVAKGKVLSMHDDMRLFIT